MPRDITQVEEPEDLPYDHPAVSQIGNEIADFDDDEPEERPVSKPRRRRWKFSKRKFLGVPRLWCPPELYKSVVEKEGGDLTYVLGTIVGCPRKKTGETWKFTWEPFQSDSFPIEESRLVSEIAATEHTTKLVKDCITRYVEFQNEDDDDGSDLPAVSQESAAVEAVEETYVTPRITRQSTGSSSHRSLAVASLETASSHKHRQWLESDSDDGSSIDEHDNTFATAADEDLQPTVETVEGDEDEDDENEEQKLLDASSLFAGLEFKYAKISDQSVVEDLDAPADYNGPEGLRPEIIGRIDDPFQALQMCGLDYRFVARLACNSNNYARKHLLQNTGPNKRLYGHPWRNITTEEMMKFLGIMLKISSMPIDQGGYQAYFRQGDTQILGLTIRNTSGFASRHMTLIRFKQIRAAFHPEDKSASAHGRDKCYQLRYAINQINACARKLRFVPRMCAFDEGGCSCRSRICPVRQYNHKKPKKFRVDFFVFACSESYFIHHVDVYQGKNSHDIGIDSTIRQLPTTQKAVVNAVLELNIHNDVHGARHIALDNRYQCPQLATLLRQRYKVYSTGTVRSNRKGWSEANLSVPKKAPRGTYQMAIDPETHIMCMQWNDSAQVNLCTSVLDNSMGTVKRQVGPDKVTVPCPTAFIRYQETMGGVDKGDQIRDQMTGFSTKAHFKKWYKKTYLALLDVMLLNALVTYNDHAKAVGKPTLLRHEFYTYVAEKMINFTDVQCPRSPELVRQPTRQGGDVHLHNPQIVTGKKLRCTVCALEGRWGTVSKFGQCKHVSKCTYPGCNVVAHATVPHNKHRIHKLPRFFSMTCFQIMHTKEGRQLWPHNKNNMVRRRTCLQQKHPTYIALRKASGLPEGRRKKAPKINADEMEMGEEQDHESNEEEIQDSTSIAGAAQSTPTSQLGKRQTRSSTPSTATGVSKSTHISVLERATPRRSPRQRVAIAATKKLFENEQLENGDNPLSSPSEPRSSDSSASGAESDSDTTEDGHKKPKAK